MGPEVNIILRGDDAKAIQSMKHPALVVYPMVNTPSTGDIVPIEIYDGPAVYTAETAGVILEFIKNHPEFIDKLLEENANYEACMEEMRLDAQRNQEM
jgi:hypothetical protein